MLYWSLFSNLWSEHGSFECWPSLCGYSGGVLSNDGPAKMPSPFIGAVSQVGGGRGWGGLGRTRAILLIGVIHSSWNLRLVTEDWGCLVDKIPKTKSHWSKFSIRIAFLERKKKLTNVCCCSSVPSFKYGIHSYLLKFHKLFFCSSTKFPLKLVKEFLCLINWKNTTGRDLRQSFLHLSHRLS